jgi:hypothetical protein
MLISFNMPFVFYPGASQEDNAIALRTSLEYLIRLNQIFLRNHTVPGLYRSGVIYGRTVTWDTIPALYEKRYGDCKSLSAALIAQYRKNGFAAKPVFRFVTNADGTTDFHILVQTAKGFEDPSKKLGMGQDENKWFGK